MIEWLITYTTDYDSTRNTATVNAKTYTEALLIFTINYKDAIALELIKKEI